MLRGLGADDITDAEWAAIEEGMVLQGDCYGEDLDRCLVAEDTSAFPTCERLLSLYEVSPAVWAALDAQVESIPLCEDIKETPRARSVMVAAAGGALVGVLLLGATFVAWRK